MYIPRHWRRTVRRAVALLALVPLAALSAGIGPVLAAPQENDPVQQALTLKSAGKLDAAAFTLREAIRKTPTHGRAHYELSLIYFQQKKDALAKAALFRAAALNPENTAVIQTIAQYTDRIANIPLEEAYAARDRQEAEDARRRPNAAADTDVSAAPAPARTRPATAPNAATKPIAGAVAPGASRAPVRLSPLAPRAGHIIGRVVTETGQPVPSFTVRYSGFEDGKLANYGARGDAMETINTSATGSGGRYAVRVPPGAYRIQAHVTYNYRGRTYHFLAEPLNEPERHDYDGLGLDKLRGGLVRDFVLKMTAKKKGASEATETVYRHAYYGGRLDLYADQYEGILGGGNRLTTPLRDAYPPDSQVEITLIPNGPMVDGTKGNPVRGVVRLGDDGKWTFMIRGIYPGVYTATARLIKPGGETMPLRLSLEPRRTLLRGAGQYDKLVVDWQPSVTIDFLPNDLGPVPRFGVKAVRLYLGE
jgi:tetratricopeptide (TPR) repeat protein